MTESLITEGQNTTSADQQQTETPATETTETTESPQQTEAQVIEGAPEAYEFQPVDGAEIGADVLAHYAEVARELNLPQNAAQKVLDKMAPVLAARQAEQIEAARTAWAENAKADKEFGGDKLPESLASAKKALEAFGSPELSKLLNETGLGNHPDVIRFMVRAGKAISGDSVVSGFRAPSAAQDARSLYPNSKMN